MFFEVFLNCTIPLLPAVSEDAQDAIDYCDLSLGEDLQVWRGFKALDSGPNLVSQVQNLCSVILNPHHLVTDDDITQLDGLRQRIWKITHSEVSLPTQRGLEALSASQEGTNPSAKNRSRYAIPTFAPSLSTHFLRWYCNAVCNNNILLYRFGFVWLGIQRQFLCHMSSILLRWSRLYMEPHQEQLCR